MDAHAFERIFNAGAEGVLALDPGEDIVDSPVARVVRSSIELGRAVSQLRVAAAKRHFGLVGGFGDTRHDGQTGLAVERVVTFIAAQVANGGVIGHQAGKIVLPVEALDGRILWICGGRRGDGDREVGLRVDAAELPPEGVIEVVRLPDVHVYAEEIHVFTVGQRSLAGPGDEVVVDFLAIGRSGQFGKKDFGDRIFEVGIDLVVRNGLACQGAILGRVEGIVELAAGAAEVARPGRRRSDGIGGGSGAAVILEALPIEEEVAFHQVGAAVVTGNPDGAADSGAEVIFLVGRLARGAILLGVQGVIAEILVGGAVE